LKIRRARIFISKMDGCAHSSVQCEQDPQRRLYRIDYTKADGENRRYFCAEHIIDAAIRRLKHIELGPFTIVLLTVPSPALGHGSTSSIEEILEKLVVREFKEGP
jgi:hypothetical protein